MYQDTVTLFNRVGTEWKATILSNVDLNADRAAIIAMYGATSQDRARLHIRFDPSTDTIQGFQHVDPKQFTGTGNEITFRSGEEFDFFLAGEYDASDPIYDNDYMDGFYNYMNATYDHVYAISNVAKYSVIPHFEVMGR